MDKKFFKEIFKEIESEMEAESGELFNINIGSRIDYAILVFCLFATFWLTVGDPDIIDAVIHYLMR